VPNVAINVDDRRESEDSFLGFVRKAAGGREVQSQKTGEKSTSLGIPNDPREKLKRRISSKFLPKKGG